MTTPTTRSAARRARAAALLSSITLDADTESARQAIVAQTGEQTAAMVRRLIREEAHRMVVDAAAFQEHLSDFTG